MMDDLLARLYATIEDRASADPVTSHTAALLAGGVAKCAEKFGEEAVEAIVAAVQGDCDALAHESADALYHLQVMLHSAGVSWAQVLSVLAAREGRSGIAEKAARTPD